MAGLLTVPLTVLLAGLLVLAGAAGPLPSLRTVGIPGGRFTPLYGAPRKGPVTVAPFRLDAFPVTNAGFLAFVRANPRWRRGLAPAVFVGQTYLAHWAGDAVLGGGAPARSPVTRVSWFAARAYCRWRGLRLPTTLEWEFAAAASETDPPETAGNAFNARILEWYAKPAPEPPPPVGSVYENLWGVHDLHGLIWEWSQDFNTALVTGESRQDASLERRRFCGSGALSASNLRDYAGFMRFAFRGSLTGSYTGLGLGFRCAGDALP